MSKIHIGLFLTLLISCKDYSTKIIAADNPNLNLINGVLYLDKEPFSGTLVTHYLSGLPKSENQYEAGRKNGYEKKWLDNGKLIEERFYTNGLKTGIHKAWWPDGTPKFEYHFNDKGEFNGKVKEWAQTGQLYMSFNYQNGQEEGWQRLWKLDGNIKANYKVINRERFGLIGLKKCYTVTEYSDEIK